MRNYRSAKFSEYLSTYALLNAIGIHDTTLIEKRDASVGFGVYCRDACDAGTVLFVVPSKFVCAASTLRSVGVPAAFGGNDLCAELEREMPGAQSLVGALAGGVPTLDWVEWCWRLALEQHRNRSHLWGWLQSLPDAGAFSELREGSERYCRLHHPAALPFYKRMNTTVAAEKRAAHNVLRSAHLAPSFEYFSTAVDVLLSRGRILPYCSPAVGTSDGAETTELGVVPFVDMVSGEDDRRRANAVLEVATTPEELPEWYLTMLETESLQNSTVASLKNSILTPPAYCLCLTLEEGVRAAEEVVVRYPGADVATGVLSPDTDALLTGLVKYHYWAA